MISFLFFHLYLFRFFTLLMKFYLMLMNFRSFIILVNLARDILHDTVLMYNFILWNWNVQGFDPSSNCKPYDELETSFVYYCTTCITWDNKIFMNLLRGDKWINAQVMCNLIRYHRETEILSSWRPELFHRVSGHCPLVTDVQSVLD